MTREDGQRKGGDVMANVVAKWVASDPELGSVHQARELRACESCGRLSSQNILIELAPSPKRGVSGRYIHGYCYAIRFGLAAFKDLPFDGGLSQVTLGEFVALGLGGRKCVLAWNRAKERRGVLLTEDHCRAAYCTQLVDEPESVLGRGCYRKATTTSDRGKPVCAWHRNGRMFRGERPATPEIP